MVCSGLGSTWGDMDVDKSTPKYGEELRNKWDKKRAEYEKAKKKYDDATAKHNVLSRSTTLPWLSSRLPSTSRPRMATTLARTRTPNTLCSRRRWPPTWLLASRCSSPPSS